MSILLKKVMWYRVNEPSIAIPITDSIDMAVGRGIDIKNNVVLITLVNPAQSFDASGNVIHKYIDSDGKIMFDEQDQFKVYLKYTDDMADIESEAWNPLSQTLPDSGYLKGVYYLIDFSVEQNIKGVPIKVKCADKCYILFSKLLARAFLNSEGLDTPHLIQKVARFSSQSQKGQYSGTGEDQGVLYDIDARLDDSEGGYIQEARKATTEKGGTNADTSFPTISMAKVWKPVYEWINELSQIENLNTANELSDASDIVYGRPFLYYVDEENRFHWFETDNTVDSTITIGTTTGIYNYKLDKKVFDTVNFLIFRGGENLYGKGTLDYYIEDTSNIKTNRMRVIAMTDIAKKLIQNEIALGNLILDNTQTVFTFSGNNYKADAYGFTTGWGVDTTGFDDDDYNNALEAEIYRVGRARCRSLAKGLAHARYKGTLRTKGQRVTIGSLFNINNKNLGQDSELIRVMEVHDTINKNGWTSDISIEQDQEAIIEGDVT